MAIKGKVFIFCISFLLCLFGTIVFFIASVRAEDLSYLVHKANESYREGQFENAVKFYQGAIKGGLNNGHIYYNLGNSYYRLNKTGLAIASYRKALLDLPRDADISANLNLARKQVKDRISSDNTTSINRLLILANYFSRYELTVLMLILLVLVCAAFIYRRIKASPFSISLFVISALALSVISGSLMCSRPGWDGTSVFVVPFSKNTKAPGVVTAPIANIHSGDGDQYQVIFILHEGVEVDVGETRKDWTQIILPTGQSGWIKATEIEIISTGN